MKIYHIVLLFFLQLEYLNSASQGSIISFEKKFSKAIWENSGTQRHPTITLADKSVKLRYSENLLNNLLFVEKIFKNNFSNCILDIKKSIKIDNCSFSLDTLQRNEEIGFTDCGEDPSEVEFSGNIYLTANTTTDDFQLNLSTGIFNNEIHLNANTLSESNFSIKKGILIALSNDFKNKITIDQSKLDLFILSGNSFINRKQNKIDILGSRINSFLFEKNQGKNIFLNMQFDSLNGIVTLSASQHFDKINRDTGHFEILIKKSVINASILSENIVQKSKITFEECTFNPGSNLNNLAFDTIIFKNCFNIPLPILLSLNTKKYGAKICFINTNVSNIKFDYNGQYSLYFDSTSLNNKDLVSGTYENLLSKFKIEGRDLSYKNLDIEYTKYKYSLEGFSGKLKNLINSAWWYYGYKKYYILYWTILLLFIFYLLNIHFWKQVSETYPLFVEEKKSFYLTKTKPKTQQFKFYINIFLYTSFIFFSLKVDFSKLSFSNTKSLLYFFIQYFTGLICVFFIFNAILKF